MLPLDNRPWARSLATAVVIFAFLAAILAAYYLNDNGELHIPEVTGILLLLLLVVPPNLAVINKKHGQDANPSHPVNHTLHTR